MAHSDILIAPGAAGTRIARIYDEELTDYFIDEGEDALTRDTPVLGRIKNVVPGLKAAFVDIGDEKDGFLPLKELEGLDQDMHEGAAILVNVASEAFEDKGARLSTNLSIAGESLAFVRGREGIFISRQITDEEARKDLKRFMEEIVDDLGFPEEEGPWGCIVRTAAEEADDDDIEKEFEDLKARVDALVKAAKKAKAPAILTDPAERLALRIERLADRSLEHIRVTDRDILKDLKTVWERTNPALAEKLTLDDDDPFEAEYVDEQVDEALDGEVELPGGGWIAIETTRALVAIDVNSGRGGGRDQDRAALKVNLEAAYEIARQLRLRSLGGVIVIDFLRLRDEGAGEKLIATLQKAFASDPSPLRIGAISEFGLVEMTRRRDGLGLLERLTEETGVPARQMRANVVADKVLAQLARERAASPGALWEVRAESAVIDVLDAMDKESKEALLSGVTLVSDGAKARDDFDVREV
ncbi:MAG: hypothetical protein EP347_07370 [Alphaproteobacteria bacterium]|nr:MAG: hypothetical protein EP347_07370 [Alphaproteobacteria bacterium]